jgi:hypothetical protein
MTRYDTAAGPRWFDSRDYAITWCRMCGYDPRHLADDPNPPALRRVHGGVYERAAWPADSFLEVLQ